MVSLTEGEEAQPRIICEKLRAQFLEEKQQLVVGAGEKEEQAGLEVRLNAKSQYDYEDAVFILEMRRVLLEAQEKARGRELERPDQQQEQLTTTASEQAPTND